MARVQFLAMAENFNWDFSVADDTLPTGSEPTWQKMVHFPLNRATQPVVIEEEGRGSTTEKHRLKKACVFSRTK